MSEASTAGAIEPGVYEHYSGAAYEVLFGDYAHWIRPAAMFVERVERDGRTVPRFARVPDDFAR